MDFSQQSKGHIAFVKYRSARNDKNSYMRRHTINMDNVGSDASSESEFCFEETDNYGDNEENVSDLAYEDEESVQP